MEFQVSFPQESRSFASREFSDPCSFDTPTGLLCPTFNDTTGCDWCIYYLHGFGKYTIHGYWWLTLFQLRNVLFLKYRLSVWIGNIIRQRYQHWLLQTFGTEISLSLGPYQKGKKIFVPLLWDGENVTLSQRWIVTSKEVWLKRSRLESPFRGVWEILTACLTGRNLFHHSIPNVTYKSPKATPALKNVPVKVVWPSSSLRTWTKVFLAISGEWKRGFSPNASPPQNKAPLGDYYGIMTHDDYLAFNKASFLEVAWGPLSFSWCLLSHRNKIRDVRPLPGVIFRTSIF